MKNEKPLGHRAYGNIPHFKGSRMTPSDKHCNEGQQNIMTNKPRDRKDLIIVQEKLDGSNCSVAKINNSIYVLTRAGYEASTSGFEQHQYFEKWVNYNINRFVNLLDEGERICGEWLLQAHGTKYKLQHEPFVVFDIMKGHDRLNYHDFLLRVLPYDFVIPRLIHIGQPFKLNKAKEAIKISGHGAIDTVEGVVYRCERENKVDFLCKYVRPDKQDGIYLDSNIWNVKPEILGL